MIRRQEYTTSTAFAAIAAATFISGSIALASPTGGVHEVPSEYATIQEALDAAGTGDTVRVAPGTYLETLVISGKAVTLRSSDGAATTVIDAEGAGRALEISGADTSGTQVDGFTITGGYTDGTGGGVLVSGSTVSINQCIFIENTARGAGAMALHSSEFDVGSCSFIRNESIGAKQEGRTGGIWNAGGSGLIHDCSFDSNATAFENGTDVYSHTSLGTTIERSSFTAPNVTEAEVHHLCLYNHVGSMMVRECTFHDISWGGVIYSWSDPILEDCTITHLKGKFAIGLSQGVSTARGCAFMDCIVPEGNFFFSPYLPYGARVDIIESQICGIAGTLDNGGATYDGATVFNEQCDDILDVPWEYPTLADALGVVGEGGLISVAPGTYDVGSSAALPCVSFTIRGTANPEDTVLTGVGLHFDDCASIRYVENLTLTNMSDYGAIRVDHCRVDIDTVRIVDNQQSGFFLDHNGVLNATNCVFSGNVSRGGYAYVNSFFSADACEFVGNSTVGSYGGGFAAHVGSGCHIENTLFKDNYATTGGAIGLSFPGTRTFIDCVFENNVSPNGPVWWTEFGGQGTCSDSTFCGHSPSDISGGFIDGGGNEFYPDGCTPVCTGDLNNDRVVDGGDLSVLLGWWGTTGDVDPSPDLDGNSFIDGSDLTILLGLWGNDCP